MSGRKDSHCDKHRKETFYKLKAKCAHIKNLCAKKIKTKSIKADTATVSNLTVDTATITDLNVSTINGTDVDCGVSNNFSGVITQVVYVNGEPQQPDNTGFDQGIFDDLWQFIIFTSLFTNLDSASGRLRSAIFNNFYECPTCPIVDLTGCPCPTPGYAVFIGNINQNILTVESIENVTLSNCPPIKGTIEIGQQIYGRTEQFLSSTIVSQISGPEGGVGTYFINNDFNQPIDVATQTMLSLSNSTLEECLDVPLRIYGVETVALNQIDGTCQSVITSISYNLNIVNRELSSRLAAVHVQIGYRDPETNEVIIKGVEIDTRQFDPSILSFGEQMNNTVLLPSELVNLAAIFNGVVQLAVYVEDGTDVLIPSVSNNSNNVQTRQVTAVEGPTTNFAVTQTNIGSDLIIKSNEDLSKQFIFYDIDLLSPYIEQNITINGAGGGGALSSASTAGGGGGGQGFNTNVNVPTDAKFFQFVSGKGGKTGEFENATGGDGEDSSITFYDGNLTLISTFSARGGKGGNVSNGGDGFNGGGGGQNGQGG